MPPLERRRLRPAAPATATPSRKTRSLMEKRAILAVYKALDARTFGVITGLKEGQKMLGR